jgi:UDP:flavonoid glycosyltransferase YjiC (YdhE family)
MTAMATGVPQVVVPTLTDHIFNARHVAATGAGVHVPGGDDVFASDVASAVSEVLTSPGYRAAAVALRAENEARPSPADVVPVLEKLALSMGVSR